MKFPEHLDESLADLRVNPLWIIGEEYELRERFPFRLTGRPVKILPIENGVTIGSYIFLFDEEGVAIHMTESNVVCGLLQLEGCIGIVSNCFTTVIEADLYPQVIAVLMSQGSKPDALLERVDAFHAHMLEAAQWTDRYNALVEKYKDYPDKLAELNNIDMELPDVF